MKHSIKNQKGLTLLEVVLYTGLVTIFLSVLTFALNAFFESRIKNQTIAEVNQQADQVVSRISQIVRLADGINSPTAGNTASSLELDALGTDNDPTTFDLSNGAVRICEGSGCTPIELTSDSVTVSNLEFKNLTNSGTAGAVRIKFTIERNSEAAGGIFQYDFLKTYQTGATIRCSPSPVGACI